MNDNEKMALMYTLKQKQMRMYPTLRRRCVTNEMGVPVSHYSLSSLGVMDNKQTLRSFSTWRRALYFVFIAVKVEKDDSQGHHFHFRGG